MRNIENSDPQHRNPSNFLRKKVAPFILAGVSALSAGNALGKNVEPSTDHNQTIETTYTSMSNETVFSPENIDLMNGVVSVVDGAINDFKYSVEKDKNTIVEKIDNSISKMQSCINKADKITDKKMAKLCSFESANLIELLKKYKNSDVSNAQILNQMLQVRAIMEEYSKKYQEAYEESKKTKND